MASLNRIVILGKLLSDPETRFLQDGLSVTKFTLPVSAGFNKAPGNIDIVCFGKLSETCGQHLKKSNNAIVEGRIQIRSYEDQLGDRKWVTEIVANKVQFVDAVKMPYQPKETILTETQKPDEFSDVEELPVDDLPF